LSNTNKPNNSNTNRKTTDDYDDDVIKEEIRILEEKFTKNSNSYYSSNYKKPCLESFFTTKLRVYFGHRQESFSIKCNFGGRREQYLTCGSEDAFMYVWSVVNSLPIFKLKLHSAAINSVVWIKDFVITCSDDRLIKILSSDSEVDFNESGKNSSKNHSAKK